MQGRIKAMLPGAPSSTSGSCLIAAFSQWRMPTQLSSSSRKRCRLTPGSLPRIAAIKASLSYHSSVPSGQASAAGPRQEAGKAEPVANPAGRRAGPARPLYNVSEDPLLRQTQLLLEASRRLREQALPLSSVDRERYYGCSSSQDATGLLSGLLPNGGLDVNGDDQCIKPFAATTAQSLASTAPQAAPDADGAAAAASFGSLTAAAGRLAAARISAVNAAAASVAAAAAIKAAPVATGEPSAAAAADGATAAGRTALTVATTTASVVVAAAALPPVASAGTASGLPAAAASAAASGWLAIEELLEEAAYSLSQELPDGQGLSPLDALMARTGGPGPGPVAVSLGPELPAWGGLQGLSESVAALPVLPELGLVGSVASGPGLVAAVSGGDRLSEMLEDLLYGLSQDVNLASTREAVVAAATAAAAELAGAPAELSRAAVAVYRSATEAQLRVGDDEAELDGASYAYDTGAEDPYGGEDPPWDLYGIVRALEAGPATVPDYSVVRVAVDAGGDSVASSTPAMAVADGAVAVLPTVTASAAPTVADAATATAVAVVEAATTAAAGTIVLGTQVAPPALPPPPPLATSTPPSAANMPAPPPAAPTPPPPATASGGEGAIDGVGGLYGVDAYGLDPESAQQLDELTAALQSLLAMPDGAASSAAAVSGLDTGAEAANAAIAAAGSPPPLLSPLGDPSGAAAAEAQAALSSLTEALRRELGAVVDGASDAVDADPSALSQAAGQVVSSALSALSLEQMDLSALPADVRLSSLLGATLQSSLDLVESALGGVRSADSTLVGGVTIAAVMAVLIRSLVALAGAVMSRRGQGAAGGAEAGGAATAARVRPVGVTSLEAAAALNNDPQALLLDIRNDSDVQEQGLPDLRPFRRGAGATTVPLPYCDFRTTPTLANPSGSLLAAAARGGSKATSPSPSPSLAPLSGSVTVSVDPLFTAKFKQLEGLSRDSRVFLLDSYGVEVPEAVMLLRSDPEVERLLGAQGVKFVEGGFAGPEGWKLTGLPVADAPLPEGAEAEGSRPMGLGPDLSGLLSGVAGLRLRYPSLLPRTLAVGAAGGAGVAVASSLDWGAVGRGAVGLAAALLLTDRALPPGVRPSGRIRQYLEAQLSEPQLGAAAASSSRGGGGGANSNGGLTAADLVARRRRTALLLRALDLAEAVGDAVVRTGGAAVAAAGSAAKGAMAGGAGAANAVVPPAIAAAANTVAPTATASTAFDIDVEADLETPPPPAATAGGAATIVLPHGMDSPQWSEAAELAVAQGQQQQAIAATTPKTAAAAMAATARQSLQPHKRSASPLRPNCRLGPDTPEEQEDSSSSPRAAATAAAGSAASDLVPPRAPSPSLAGRLGDAFRHAAGAVVRAASPSKTAGSSTAAAATPAARTASPGGGSQPDTLDLMVALAAASALSSVDSGRTPGWPAVSFPRASAGQAPLPEADTPAPTTEKGGAVEALPAAAQGREATLPLSSLLATPSPPPSSSDPAAPSSDAETVTAAERSSSSRSLWSSWRQELDAVAPPLPTLPSAMEDPELRAAAGGASVAASRMSRKAGPLRRSSDDAPAGAGAADPDGGGACRQSQPPPQHQRRKRPLRTSSPERAAAAGAAMRQLRAQMGGLDDDGLSSGMYGSGGAYSINSSSGKAATEPQIAGGAGVATDGNRAGSAGVAAARMARGMGGLSPGLQARRQQASDRTSSGGGAAGRQKQPLRTASPERAAAAAAAMRQLRAEVGGPPNDSSGAAPAAAAAVAVLPRDWRRELEAAAGVPETEGSGEEEGEEAPAAPRSGGFHAAPAPSRSPRNWRDRLEASGIGSGGGSSGGGMVPADWRSRVELGASAGLGAGQAGGGGDDSGGHVALRTAASPGRAKLSGADRAARDARLQDWRARV